MNKTGLDYRVAEIEQSVGDVIGTDKAVGIIAGTGWKEGVNSAFEPTGVEVPYDQLNLPGMDEGILGHEKSLRVGTVGGRRVVIIGRVHANESTDPDSPLAMTMIIGALRRQLAGLIITTGVGSLHGAIPEDEETREQEGFPLQTGDIAVTTDISTLHIGRATPVIGAYPDFYHKGIHREDNGYFDLAVKVVREVQGRCCQAVYSFNFGPYFEGPNDKANLRREKGDVVGMSGLEHIPATLYGIPTAGLNIITNGATGEHSHGGNVAVGQRYCGKTSDVLRKLVAVWPPIEK